MRRSALFLAVSLTLVCLFGCEKKAPPPPAPTVETAVGDYMQLVKARRSNPIDFARMDTIVNEKLAPYLADADARHNTELLSDARGALQACLTGKSKSPHAAAMAQIIEKSVQRALLLDFLAGLNNPGDTAALKRTRQAAPVMRAICDRRQKWAGKGDQYTGAFDLALANLAKAATVEAKSRAAKSLHALAEKMIMMSVLYEVDGYIRSRGKNPSRAAEKREEARLYYESLYPLYVKRNHEGAENVRSLVHHPSGRLRGDLVVKQLLADYQTELADVDLSALGLAR